MFPGCSAYGPLLIQRIRAIDANRTLTGCCPTQMGTMAQGFAFGTGSSIARGAVGAAGDALFGGSSEQAAQPAAQQAAAAPAAQDVCAVDKRAFYQCLETSNGDASRCQELFNQLSMCQENAKWQSA